MKEHDDGHLEKDANEHEHEVVHDDDPESGPEVAAGCFAHRVRGQQHQTEQETNTRIESKLLYCTTLCALPHLRNMKTTLIYHVLYTSIHVLNG